jgi:uncharacterized repeat protein (TIGR01451 family)
MLLALAVVGSLLPTVPAGAQGVAPRALISAPVDERSLVPLGGSTRPEATARNDRGRVPDELPMEHMQLVLRRPSEREAALQQYLHELHDRTSPNYHRWLSRAPFEQRFGLAPQDLSAITGWLAQQGFVVNTVYAGTGIIDFSGSAGQVRAALHTEIHYLEVAGARHIANTSDPQIPAALAPAVRGLVSLHDFSLQPNFRPKSSYTYHGGSAMDYAVVPADLATLYNLNPLFTAGTSGKGQSLAVLENTDLPAAAATDWNTFRGTFGLSGYSAGTLTQVNPGSCQHRSVSKNQEEAELDAEWASAAAPNAAIEVASCADTSTYGVLIALQNLVNSASPPSVVSISYGQCETLLGASANAAFAAAYAQADAKGISVFVASGDAGAAYCDDNQGAATHGLGVNGIASTPNNVAVGGTDFADTYAGSSGSYWSASNNLLNYGSALSYVPEIPWDDSCASALLYAAEGYGAAYGSNGYCNSTGGAKYLTTISGSGGPSQCATGTPALATPALVSGSCAGYAKPSWQSLAAGNPADGLRDLPDVSLFAGNGFLYHSYVICYSAAQSCAGAPSSWAMAGGTSFAAPILAGIQALIDQIYGAQGNPNYVYYELAAGQAADTALGCQAAAGRNVSAGCVFYDVAQGDIDVNCTGGSYDCYDPGGTNGVLSQSSSTYSDAYAAGTGWDFATGLGSVNAANLVTYWNSAGLSLGVTGSALPGGLLSYALQLGNTGPQTAAGVTVTSTLPGGVTLVTAGSSAGCSQSGATLSCTVGNVAPGASPSLVVELQPGGLSSVSLSFAAATSTDSNLDLNEDVASITLSPAGSSEASSSADGPMPPWALGALGAGILGIARATESALAQAAPWRAPRS